MSERYLKLFSLEENLYIPGSPVLIAAGALLKDTQTGRILGQLKLQNISDQPIQAATVELVPLDTVGNPLGAPVSHQYLDLDAARDAYWGSKDPIVFSDPATRAYTVSVKEVVFSDNSIWTAPSAAWKPLPKRVSLFDQLHDDDFVEQYKRHFGSDCAFICHPEEDLWYCSCGALNHQNEAACHHCNRKFDSLYHLDTSILQKELDERMKENAVQKAKQQKQLQERARRLKKALCGVLIVAVVVVVAVLAKSLVQAHQEKGFLTLYDYIQRNGTPNPSGNSSLPSTANSIDNCTWNARTRNGVKSISYIQTNNQEHILFAATLNLKDSSVHYTFNLSNSAAESYRVQYNLKTLNGSNWFLEGDVDIRHYTEDTEVKPERWSESSRYTLSSSEWQTAFAPMCTEYFRSMMSTLSQDIDAYGLNLSVADLGFTSY